MTLEGGTFSSGVLKGTLRESVKTQRQGSLVLQCSKIQSGLTNSTFHEVFCYRSHSEDSTITLCIVKFLLYINQSNTTVGVKPASRRSQTLQKSIKRGLPKNTLKYILSIAARRDTLTSGTENQYQFQPSLFVIHKCPTASQCTLLEQVSTDAIGLLRLRKSEKKKQPLKTQCTREKPGN